MLLSSSYCRLVSRAAASGGGVHSGKSGSSTSDDLCSRAGAARRPVANVTIVIQMPFIVNSSMLLPGSLLRGRKPACRVQ